jgi:hypothetical protein
MHLVSTLNVVGKQLIAPHLTFAQIFQLKGYGQYGLHANIVNVPTNLNLDQYVLPKMPHNDLYQLNKTPLYVNVNVLVRRD